MQEYIASIHIHSVYSDGLKTPPDIAKDAAVQKVDIIMITDHNVFPSGFNGYYTFENRKVLLITGEEIHDKNRQPQKNHLLALGIHQDWSPAAHNPQQLIDAIQKDGGISFIAHAYDPELPMINEADLSWVDWSVQRFTGLELWNNLSELKIRVKKSWQAAFYAFFPKFMALQPPEQIRSIWDTLLSENRRVLVIGGVDAHTFRFHFGPITKDVFPYSYHFRAIHTHILLESELSGNAEDDSRNIIEALRQGQSFVGYDLAGSTRGFRFYVTNQQILVPMGAGCVFQPGQKITAEIPAPAECRLIHNGKMMDVRKVRDQHTWDITEPGVYRLECYRRYLGRKRGWIFSNPIWVTEN